MSERMKLLKCLDAAEFALYETRLFLDTHPCDEAARSAAEEYARRAKLLRARYEEVYGPLTAASAALVPFAAPLAEKADSGAESGCGCVPEPVPAAEKCRPCTAGALPESAAMSGRAGTNRGAVRGAVGGVRTNGCEQSCCAWLRGPWPWEYVAEGRR